MHAFIFELLCEICFNNLTIEYLLLKKNNTLPASAIKNTITVTSEELASQVDELYDIYNDVAESINNLRKPDGDIGVTLFTRKVGKTLVYISISILWQRASVTCWVNMLYSYI